MLQANTIFVLNPDYHFKSDKDRIVMYSGKKVSKLSSEDWVSFLHPLQAQILNSFSHILPFYKQCELLANKFNITKEQVGEMVKQYVKNSTPISLAPSVARKLPPCAPSKMISLYALS